MPEKWFPHLSGYRGWNTKHGHRGAGWRSFSGGEGNDKAIVKRIFIRETWRNQRQDKKERGTSRFSRIPLYKDSHRTPVRDGGRNDTLSGRRPIPIYCQAAEKHPSAALPSSFVVAAYIQVRLTPQGFGLPRKRDFEDSTCIWAFLSSLAKITSSPGCSKCSIHFFFNLLIEGGLILCGGEAFSPLPPIGYF